MKINEVLDSTKSWATIKDISLDKYDEIESGYRKRLEIIKTTHGLANVLDNDQYSAIVSEVKRQLDDFIKETTEYSNDLKNLGINNDLDLTSKITSVDNMGSNISQLSAKFS